VSYPAEPFLNIYTEIILPEASCAFFLCVGNVTLIVVFSFYPNSVVDYLANEVAKTLSPVAQKYKRAALATKILYQRI